MGRLKKVRIYVIWADKRIESGEVPVSLLGQILPGIYEHPAVWRVEYKDRNRVYYTYADFRSVYGGVVLPKIDEIERRRYNADMEYLGKEIDAIGKNRD